VGDKGVNKYIAEFNWRPVSFAAKGEFIYEYKSKSGRSAIRQISADIAKCWQWMV
jgi:hypothetical protein